MSPGAILFVAVALPAWTIIVYSLGFDRGFRALQRGRVKYASKDLGEGFGIGGVRR